MSVRLSVLRTSIRTCMKFDAEQYLRNSVGGFLFWSKSNTSDGHLNANKDLHVRYHTHISGATPYMFIGTINVSKQISTKSEIRIFYSVHFFFFFGGVRLKGLRHIQKGVQATEPFCYAFVSKLLYSTLSGWALRSSVVWRYVTGWLVPDVSRQRGGHDFNGRSRLSLTL